MVDHFLKEHMDGSPEFTPEPIYNRYGDSIEYLSANEATYAERVDSVLTLYRAIDDDRVVGFKIKDVAALMRELGHDGILLGQETRKNEIVSVAVILFTAFNAAQEPEGEKDKRIRGYLSALQNIKSPKVELDDICV